MLIKNHPVNTGPLSFIYTEAGHLIHDLLLIRGIESQLYLFQCDASVVFYAIGKMLEPLLEKLFISFFALLPFSW